MPVIGVGKIIPKHHKIAKQVASKEVNQQKPVINTFEFHAGFVPHKPKNDMAKVEHFIDQLI